MSEDQEGPRPSLRAGDTAITEPGFYRMSSRFYHADPCPTPALSTSMAISAATESMAHCYLKTPQGGAVWEPTAAADLGSAAHALAFGDPRDVVVLKFDDWRTDAAKKARDIARLENKTPILVKTFDVASAMAEIAQPAIEQLLGISLNGSENELVIAWQRPTREGLNHGAWRRTRIDVTTPDLLVQLDYKTTAGSVEPIDRQRALFDGGYHIQQAQIESGLDILAPDTRGRRRFIFLSQEQKEPFALSAHRVTESSMSIARRQYLYAERQWDKSLHTGLWPDFNRVINDADMPPWVESIAIQRSFEEDLGEEEWLTGKKTT